MSLGHRNALQGPLTSLADRCPGLGQPPRRSGVALRWWVRKPRGLGGEFDRPEDSERSTALAELWERKWPTSEPIGYLLRYRYEARWVRFHSLPGSKRWPETSEEVGEIIRRQRTLISELSAGAPVESLVVIALDHARDNAGGWSKRYLPGAWPWRISLDDLEDPDDHHDHRRYFWVKTGLTPDSLDNLLAAIADDRGRAVITAPDLDWLCCPYDGGVDVILPTAEARDAVRSRHPDWLASDSEM